MKMASVAVMEIFFFENVIPKVFDHSCVQLSLSTIRRHRDNGIWNTPYIWRFYGHGCQVFTKTLNLLLYACHSLKQA